MENLQGTSTVIESEEISENEQEPVESLNKSMPINVKLIIISSKNI